MRNLLHKIPIPVLTVAILFAFAMMGGAAGLWDTGDQNILGNWTFENKVTAEKELTTEDKIDVDDGFEIPYAAKTADYTVLASDVGSILSNSGAGGTVVFTLPDGSALDRSASSAVGPFHFMIATKDSGDITLSSTDTILGIAAVAGQTIFNAGSTTGVGITLWNVGDNTWIITNKDGTWVDKD